MAFLICFIFPILIWYLLARRRRWLRQPICCPRIRQTSNQIARSLSTLLAARKHDVVKLDTAYRFARRPACSQFAADFMCRRLLGSKCSSLAHGFGLDWYALAYYWDATYLRLAPAG
jgi:hypothetical protein